MKYIVKYLVWIENAHLSKINLLDSHKTSKIRMFAFRAEKSFPPITMRKQGKCYSRRAGKLE